MIIIDTCIFFFSAARVDHHLWRRKEAAVFWAVPLLHPSTNPRFFSSFFLFFSNDDVCT